jgi:hypothetical protein
MNPKNDVAEISGVQFGDLRYIFRNRKSRLKNGENLATVLSRKPFFVLQLKLLYLIGLGYAVK